MEEIGSYLEKICDLPEDFHEAGVMTSPVLKTIFRLASSTHIKASAETGCGKSTLLLSWLSDSHTVFSLEAYGSIPAKSYQNVQTSELLNEDAVHFVLGPSQRTLPKHSFSQNLQFALIDGPHGFPFPMLEYYYLYPALEEGGVLVIDDIHIPTVRWLHDFLTEDAMFNLVEIVDHTSFFRRTSAPTFNPIGDDWWLQSYNANRLDNSRSISDRLSLARGFIARLLR